MSNEDPAARAAEEAERLLPCSPEPHIYVCGSVGHFDICPGKYRAQVAAALLAAERRGAERLSELAEIADRLSRSAKAENTASGLDVTIVDDDILEDLRDKLETWRHEK